MTAEVVALDTEHHAARLLPTLPGCVRGIVGVTEAAKGRDVYTLQCENCYALEKTDMLVLMKTKFHTLGNDRRRLCPGCRAEVFKGCGCYSCKDERRGA
jgi:hypothetical protein